MRDISSFDGSRPRTPRNVFSPTSGAVSPAEVFAPMSAGSQQARPFPDRELVGRALGGHASEFPVVPRSFAPVDPGKRQDPVAGVPGRGGGKLQLGRLDRQQRHYAALSDLLGTGHLM